MQATPTKLEGLLLLTPRIHRDERGTFCERWNRKTLAEAGIQAAFVQANHSLSYKRVLRGLHYQISAPQGKLIQVLRGTIFDVAVDLRKSSSTFGQWEGIELSAADNRDLWIPPGFAHGFYVLSDEAEVLYQVTEHWSPADERTLRWDDPDLAIDWPLTGQPLLSDKDARGTSLADADVFD